MAEGVIACAVCLNIDNSQRVPAVTVIKGLSVCDKHVGLASEPQFDIWKLRTKGGAT